MAKGKKFSPEIWEQAQRMYEAGRTLEIISFKTGIAINTLKNNIKNWETPTGLVLNTDTALFDLEYAYAKWAHEITSMNARDDAKDIHFLSVAIKNVVRARLEMLNQQDGFGFLNQIEWARYIGKRLVERIGETDAAPFLAELDAIETEAKTSLLKLQG